MSPAVADILASFRWSSIVGLCRVERPRKTKRLVDVVVQDRSNAASSTYSNEVESHVFGIRWLRHGHDIVAAGGDTDCRLQSVYLSSMIRHKHSRQI